MRDFRQQLTAAFNSLWYGKLPLYWLLWPFSLIYRVLVAGRRFAYRKGFFESVDVDAPVVVIGNLTVGGTGKTPLVIWLARRLGARGFRVGIVCRGYRATATQWPQLADSDSDPRVVGDEAKLIARSVECPVAVGPDRAEAAGWLLRSVSLDVILSDDGLQHYRMRRAYEVVVVDGSRGFGNGQCLPAGPLREPTSRLVEADAVVVHQGELGPRRAFRSGLSVIRVYELVSGVEKSLADFRGLTVHAVAGIGNPERFFDLLTASEVDVRPHALADHADLTPADIDFGDDLPVLLTEKDAVKCQTFAAPDCWCLVVGIEFQSDDGSRFENDIVKLLEQDPINR